jgi:flavin-dependent dehydrogenase
MWDAIIAGAGPAGSVSASVLASAGHRVLMVDAASPLAFKIGEALPGAAVRLLRSLGLPAPDKSGPHSQIRGNLSSWNADDLVSTDFICDPGGCGWRLKRALFDSALRDAAVRSGASLKLAQVTAITRVGKVWRLFLTNSETESCRWIIDATGRRAFLARRLGARRVVDTRLTAIYAVGRANHPFYLDRTIVESVPHGWWYAARLPSGSLLAGLHVSPRDAAYFSKNRSAWLRALFETRHVTRLFPDATFEGVLHIFDASGSRLDRLAGDGWAACGDAAFSLDPLSGQGLFAAIHGGMMAGRSVDSLICGTNEALSLYLAELEQVWKIYSKRLREFYRSETRWPSHVFWSTIGRAPKARNGTCSQQRPGTPTPTIAS